MMKTTSTLLLAALSALTVSCASKPQPLAPGYQTNTFDNEIPLSEIPPAVSAAAKAQIPGLRIENADVQQRGEARLYEIDGTANGRDYELTLTADGRVLHVESE